MFEHKPRLRIKVEHRPAGYQGIDDETPIRRADIKALFRLIGIIAIGLFISGFLLSALLFLRGGDPEPSAAALVLSGTSPIVSTFISGITLSPPASLQASVTPTPSLTPTLTATDTAAPTFTLEPSVTLTPTVDLTAVFIGVYGPLAHATYERLVQTAVDATVFAQVTPLAINAQRTLTVIEIKGLTGTRS